MTFEDGDGRENIKQLPLRRMMQNLRTQHDFAVEFLFSTDPRTPEEEAAFTKVGEEILKAERVLGLLEDVVDEGQEEPKTLRSEAIQTYNHLAEFLADAQRLLNVRDGNNGDTK